MTLLPLLPLLLPSVLSLCNHTSSYDYSVCPEYKIPEPLRKLEFVLKSDYCGDNLNNQYITKQMCGWEGMTQSECSRAGCCYNTSTNYCSYPIRPATSTFLYNSSLLTYNEADHMCRRQGMKLFCPRSLLDLQILESHTCGVTWLRGDITGTSSGRNYTLPYFDHIHCNKDYFSCDIGHPTNDRLTFIRGHPTHLTHVNKSSRLYSLCVKEEWSLRLFMYPQHCLFDDHSTDYHSMRCALQYTGHLQVVGSWVFTRASGQVSHSSRIYNPESDGIYVNNFYFFKTVKKDDLGRYECSFTFRNANGVEAPELERGGYAYIYSKLECSTTVNVIDQNTGLATSHIVTGGVIETLAGVTVTLTVNCKGYPAPRITAKIRNGNSTAPYPPTLITDPATYSWVLPHFATQVKPWLEYERTINVSFHSTIPTITAPAEIELTLRKVFVRFSTSIPEKEYVLKIGDPHLMLPCAGNGFGALYKADSTWALNGHRLDFEDPALGQYISVTRDSYNGAVNITLNPASGAVSGSYSCTVDTGAGRPQSYNTLIKVQAPPLAAAQPYIKEVKNGSMVVAVPEPYHVWNNTGYKTILIVNGTQRVESHSGLVSGTEILTTFSLTKGSSYQVLFTSSNEWGESGESELSESFVYSEGIPSTAPTLQSSEGGTNQIEVQLGGLAGVDEYEIVLYDAEHKIVKTVRSKVPGVKLTDLSPGTTYYIAVRGVKHLGSGREVLGPMSQRTQIETESGLIPAPTGFKGNQLENDGVFATVLLRWEAPKMKLSLLEGYQLEIRQIIDLVDRSSRRKRQALQTISISYTASAFVAKELASGATYEFGLKCVTEQGISEPAKSLVETNEDINCPAEKVSNKKCEQPRVSADGRYVAYIAEKSSVKRNLDCYLGTGLQYQGTVSRTRSDVECAMWSEEKLLKRNITFYQDKVLSHNKCRNFGSAVNSSAPWCFTSEEEWQDCGVPICGHDNVTVTRTTADGSARIVQGYTERFLCLGLEEDEVEVSFRSEKIFGSLDCKSPPSPTVGVKVNQSSKWLAKIWVKYLLVELVLFSVLAVTWVVLASRRNIIITRDKILSNSCDTHITKQKTRTTDCR